MQRLYLVLALWGVGILSAAPLCTDVVGPLTLDRLLATGDQAGGCTIEDKLFDNFTYSIASQGGGATVPSASGITVTPLVTPFNPGLRFTTLLAAGPGGFADITLGYTVTVDSGGHLIKDNSLLMAGGHAGTGIAAVDETKCLGGTFAAACAGGNVITLHTTSSSVASIPFDTETFAPVRTVDVLKDIGVTGGMAGTATITTIEQRYSEVVPEPASLLLIGSALLGLGILRRRFV